MAAVARACHARCTAPSAVRHRRTRASRVGAPRTDHPRRPPPARPVTHRPVSTTRPRLVTARAASTPPAHPDDDSPSTSGRIDDAYVPRGFDLDPALAAWITARFLFIWISLGYLPVPILAMLEGVDDAAALRTSHLALALVASECGKLGGTTTMLNAELGSVRWTHETWRIRDTDGRDTLMKKFNGHLSRTTSNGEWRSGSSRPSRRGSWTR